MEKKSEAELEELLEKQEKLLRNKELIAALPDKGKKISVLVEKIRQALESKKSLDETADRLNKISLGVDRTYVQIDDEVMRSAKAVINSKSNESIKDKQIPNSYEFIMKQNNKSFMVSHPEKFKPKRILQDKNVKNCSSKVESSSNIDDPLPSNRSYASKENTQKMEDENWRRRSTTHRLKHRYDACLEELFPFERKFARGVQMIGIDESVILMHRHETMLKEAELKRAKALLAANSNIKLETDMSQWHGEEFNKYRNEQHLDVEDDNVDDDDNDNADCDYPDDDD